MSRLSSTQSPDGVGYSSHDINFGKSLAMQTERVGSVLSASQIRAGWKLLSKYKSQLKKHGIRFEKIEEPPEPPVAEKSQLARKLITLDKTGKIAIVEFSYDPCVVSEIRQVPGAKFYKASKSWKVPITPASIKQLLNFAEINKIQIPYDLKEIATRFEKEMQRRFEISSAISMQYNLKPGFGVNLLQHQGAPVWLGVRAKRIMIADDPGLGKTIEALAIVHELDAFPLLVISTGTGKGTWRYEASKILRTKRVVQLDGILPKESHAKFLLGRADIVVANYDILAQRSDKPESGWLRHLVDMKFKAIIFDESHKLASSKAERTKACKALASTADVRIALTGTPAWNRGIDLLTQVELLDRIKDIGGKEYFLNHTCAARHNGFGMDYTASHLSEDERTRRLTNLNTSMRSVFYIRRTRGQVLKFLPPIIRRMVPVDLGARASEYKSLEKGNMAFVSDQFLKNIEIYSPDIQLQLIEQERKKIEAARVGVASALSYAAELSVVLAEMKLPFVEKWIDDFLESAPDEKLIVFAHHRKVITFLANRFKVPMILGGTTSEERVEAQRAFQEDSKCRLIILSLMAAAENLTLTKANNIAFAEILYTPGIITQAEGRAYGRVNDPHGIISHFLLVEDSLDHKIWEAVISKQKDVESATEGATKHA